jgi:hypothetical protein
MIANMPKKEKKMSRRDMNMATEIFLRMAMLVLIEDFGFGTKLQKGKTSRLQRFVTSFEEKAKRMHNTFGEEMLDGMNARLEMHGVYVQDKKDKI